ncbi:hypothetical protein LWC35_29000 [Pseudonocardia kujensis]|uniref:hypothetical protein n=1 Tax=Pseudonocardia kujensis TaxID=1128675 RepID=UPI001E3A7F6B|nr:hypothetical protein [Pseudonocardia kujensis]MCE0766914.1 hypothetical protein [Pseudonocardia kujensis]
MLQAAECLIEAERVLNQVLDGVAPDQWRIRVPPLPDGPDPARPTTLDALVRHHVRTNTALPDLLAGRAPEGSAELADLTDLEHRQDLPALAREVSDKACAAAAAVADPGAPTGEGGLPAGELLWRRAVGAAFTAHEVSVHRGSVNPLTEHLARALWEHTEPEAARWRALGWFGAPLTPVPADVSWRDRFLMLAGRDPHPLWDR